MSLKTNQRRQPSHHSLTPKRNLPRSWWRHPQNRAIKVPQMAATAIALMEMGVSNYAIISAATGLSEQEIQEIDMAEDRNVRQLGVVGIPHGVYFRLLEKVRCPRCDAFVTIAPCVACDVRRQPDEEETKADNS